MSADSSVWTCISLRVSVEPDASLTNQSELLTLSWKKDARSCIWSFCFWSSI